MKQRITTSIVKRQAMGATQVSGLALMEMAKSLLGTKENRREIKVAEDVY